VRERSYFFPARNDIEFVPMDNDTSVFTEPCCFAGICFVFVSFSSDICSRSTKRGSNTCMYLVYQFHDSSFLNWHVILQFVDTL
jgi:hypothetical protein